MARKDDKLARKARLSFEKWQTYFQQNITQYHFYTNFVLGRQWEDKETEVLKSFRKTPLQVNKLRVLANNVLGELQQNTPQLQVTPMEAADYMTAQIREVLVKDITLGSDSRASIQRAAGQGLVGGFSALIVEADYESPAAFEQRLCIHDFKDPTKCFWDISAEQESKIDGMHCGYLQRISRAKFRAVYGRDIEKKILNTTSVQASEEEIALAVEPDNIQSGQFVYADDDSIACLYFYQRKYTTDTLYKLSNGRSVYKDEMEEIVRKSQEMMVMQAMEEGTELQEPAPEIDVITLWDGGEPVTIMSSREVKKSRIKCYKIAGDYVLEETDAPTDDLPLVFVDQQSWYDKAGKQICASFLQDVKDVQRYLNYLATQSAYVLKVSRYDQWLGSKNNVSSGQTAAIWKDPLNFQGMLTYDESPNGDRPQQIAPPELPQSFLTQYQRAMEDLYTGTGLYPTRLGKEGNEISGAAIDARTRQGSYSTQNFRTAIDRAIEAVGILVNQAIPRVYDTERVLALQMPDSGLQNVTINRQADAYGEVIENDIRKGTYQVRLMPGASFEGQKAEALQSLREVLQADPSTFRLIADLYTENLPLSNNIELRNRLKTLVPPEIIQAGKTGELPPQQQQQPDPAVMAQQQQAQVAMETLELKKQELQLQAQKQQIELQIELQKLETERLEVAGKLEEQKLRYMAETDRTRSDNAIAHADNLTKILTHAAKG